MPNDIPCTRPGCNNIIPNDIDFIGAEAHISFVIWRVENGPAFGHTEATMCGNCANDLYDFWNAKTRSLKLS